MVPVHFLTSPKEYFLWIVVIYWAGPTMNGVASSSSSSYQIQLANSEDLVYAPKDTDEYVRPYVDSPPAKRRKLDIYPPEVPSCDRINTHS